jgi:hypothetical protein
LPLAFGLYLLVAVISGLFAGNFFLSLIAIGVGVIAATLYQGMVVSLVRDVQDGRRDSSVGQLIEETWPVAAPLIGAGILAGIGIAIGLIILIVPGLILLTISALAASTIYFNLIALQAAAPVASDPATDAPLPPSPA